MSPLCLQIALNSFKVCSWRQVNLTSLLENAESTTIPMMQLGRRQTDVGFGTGSSTSSPGPKTPPSVYALERSFDFILVNFFRNTQV